MGYRLGMRFGRNRMLTRHACIVKYHSFLRKATRYNRSRGGEISRLLGGGI